MNRTKVILKETLKGKTFGRTLLNLALSDIVLSGQGIDLGSKSNSASYYRFLKKEKDTRIVFTDRHPRTENIIEVNLEKKMPFADHSQDFLILINVLEHLFDYQTCISETYRILKKSGKLIGGVPFFYRIHDDPDDHFRYTQSSLYRIFREGGYRDIHIEPLAYGPFTTAATLIAPMMKFKPCATMTYFMAIGIDKILSRLFRQSNLVKYENFPLRYFFVCTK